MEQRASAHSGKMVDLRMSEPVESNRLYRADHELPSYVESQPVFSSKTNGTRDRECKLPLTMSRMYLNLFSSSKVRALA